MEWINEILSELRKFEKDVGVHPKHFDVSYWFLYDGKWCDTYTGNVDIDWLNIDLLKLNHPERYFELVNDWYSFIDYDNILIEQRKLRKQLCSTYKDS